METFYITTPIYYVNDTPHIGHAYTTVVADILNRYHKLFADDSFFLTGTDEHGQKVQNAAKARGLEPLAHCDEMVLRFQAVWQELAIQPDFFIRTTMPFHQECVQRCLQVLFDKGEIYSDEYEGWYSVSEEIFYTEKDLVNGKSPAGKEVQKVKEKNYFFKMSAYQERLIKTIEENPYFIQPDGKRSEVLGFLKAPLGDLCISRPKSRLNWGIELPFDSEYVTYVWFDALVNYISALGIHTQGPKGDIFDRYWQSAVHLIGKDILMTHAVYWPTMLMALNLPLPKQIFAHGWWLTDVGSKMSKSEGPVVAPLDMKDLVGVDPFRYFLIRDIYLGNDAKFSKELVLARINSELANNFGNLASRTLNLVQKYLDGAVPAPSETQNETKELCILALQCAPKVRDHIRAMAPNVAVEQIISLLTATNKYLDTLAPWKAAKSDLPLAAESLYSALEVLRISAILLSPVMPNKMATLLGWLGWNKPPNFEDAASWQLLSEGTKVSKGEVLFPRI
ncbi:MAG: methionine--tRNA ligase [Deltaproteobacteria bacterium]|nr:methionine--tRNA ligase [Deltaproteobacteria bacterium]